MSFGRLGVLGTGFGRLGSSNIPVGEGETASEQILTLATADGWTAVYDPTNPNTRSLRVDGDNSYYEEIEDGLGNLPALAQASASLQPLYVVGGFGQLDAGRVNALEYLTTGLNAFTSIPQPYVIGGLVKLAEATATFRRIFTGTQAGTAGTSGAYLAKSDAGNWGYYAGALVASAAAADTDAHNLFGLFNGASSSLRLDGTGIAAGDPSTRAFVDLTYGARADGATPIIADLGVLLVRADVDAAAVGRMETLLATLAGIS